MLSLSSCPFRCPLVTRSGVAMTTEWWRALVQEAAAAAASMRRRRYFNGLVAESLDGARKATFKQSLGSYPTCATIMCEIRQRSKKLSPSKFRYRSGLLRTSQCYNKNLAIANRSRVSCINTNNNTMTLKSGLVVTQGH